MADMTATPRSRSRSRALNRRGAAAAEFALVAIPFFITIMVLMEVCWQLLTGAALDHAALKASRFGATGSSQIPTWQRGGTPADQLPGSRSAAIIWLVSQSTGGLIKLDSSRLTVASRSFSNLGAVTGAGAENAGGGGAIVAYTITYRQPFLTGGIASSVWGGGNAITHQTTIVVKNEPFETGGGLGG